MVPHGRSTFEDIRVSAHEAGHAILRWVNGLEIDGISVNPRVIDGRKINGRVWGDTGREENDSDYFCRVTVLVAGNVAEDTYLGESYGLRGSDKRKAYRYAGALCSTKAGIEHLIAAAEAEAAHVLRQYHHVFDALISALCEKREMDGKDVVALIEGMAI